MASSSVASLAQRRVRAAAEQGASAMPACLLGIALILLWQINAFRRDGLILGNIPQVIIGVAAEMWLMGSMLDINVMLGVLSTARTVINNRIVLIKRIDAEHAEGSAVRPALLVACAARGPSC